MGVAEDIRKSTAIGGLAFGAVAALAPRVFGGIYGMPNDPHVKTMTRLWGTRTAVLGTALLLADRPADQRRLMMMATAMSAADTVFIASAGGTSVQGRVLGAITSAGFAGAGAYSLTL